MFSFLKDLSDTYTWPVEARVPVSGGKTAAIKFEAEFNRLEKDRLKAIMARIQDGASEQSDQDLLDEVLAGIRAKDDSGKMTTLPDDVRDELFAIIGVQGAIVRAFFTSITGEKAKN